VSVAETLGFLLSNPCALFRQDPSGGLDCSARLTGAGNIYFAQLALLLSQINDRGTSKAARSRDAVEVLLCLPPDRFELLVRLVFGAQSEITSVLPVLDLFHELGVGGCIRLGESLLIVLTGRREFCSSGDKLLIPGRFHCRNGILQ